MFNTAPVEYYGGHKSHGDETKKIGHCKHYNMEPNPGQNIRAEFYAKNFNSKFCLEKSSIC